MSGLDELLLVLDWMIGRHYDSMPKAVLEAYRELKQRQAEHRPFDDAQHGD